MKRMLPGDRAPSAVPALSSFASFASRFGAWARESLLARAIAAVIALFVLALIGGSAVAGGNGAAPPLAAAPPAPSSTTLSARTEAPPDAGAIPTTRPELLPREPPVPPPATSEPGVAGNALATSVTRATPDDPVDLNTARIEDLRRLPGVGAKRAEAILALRARLPGGRFRQIEDLLKVKGVGRAMIKRLHPLVRISGT